MNRESISSACGFGNTSTAGIDDALDQMVRQELTNAAYWFGVAPGTVANQNPSVLVGLVPLSTNPIPLKIYRDPDGFVALVSADLTFEQCHPKFQEYCGWKLIVQTLLEQGWTSEDLAEQTKKLTNCQEDLGKLQLGLRSITCTREVAKLRNRVAQYAGVPGMNDYSETTQGWQIEQQLLEGLNNDSLLLTKRDLAGALWPYVAEYLVLKVASQLKPDEEMLARYKRAREDLVNWQGRISRVKQKYLTVGTYFNTFWGTVNLQDPITLAAANGGHPILYSVTDPEGNLAKITVDTPWALLPGMLQSLILMEEQLEDRVLSNSNSPVMQSEAILFAQRLKDWRKENDDKLSPPIPGTPVKACRNKALVYLDRQREGEYCATQDAYAIEEHILSVSTQIIADLDPNQPEPTTFDPMWMWLAWEAAWMVAPDPNISARRAAAAGHMHRWMSKYSTQNTDYNLNTWTYYG